MMLADSGNFSDNPTPQGDVRTRALLEGMHRMGYRVVNVGERDIRQGWDVFHKRTADARVNFISSNIVDKQTRKPVFPTYQVVEAESPDGSRRVRIGVVGAVRFNPIFSRPGPSGRPMAIVHPAEPVREAVAGVQKERVDLTVLLAAMHRDDAARLVQDIPGIDFVLGSYGGIYTDPPERYGETALIYSGNQGKRVGVARVFFDDQGKVTDYQSKLHHMGHRYPGVEEMLKFVDEAQGRAERATPGVRGATVTPAKLTVGLYTGSAVCGTCHAEAYRQWESTSHAHALETIENDPQGADAACITCHVTALGQRGGFTDRDRTPQLASVGCEACHGPGRDHAASGRPGYGKVSVANCSVCHTREHSPAFDYYTYLGQVKHQETVQGSR